MPTMKHYSDHWITEWCADNGWTELFQERPGHYWAFPPGAVMPEPIPSSVLRSIKAAKGWCEEERLVVWTGAIAALVSLVLSYFTHSPMPLVFAFACGAVMSALLEVEED
ncbi:hypothetical protein PN441_07325 [Spirulina major CS-329]|nr:MULTISPECIES: hypothetical protein [Spirulina]MDB9495983.1 hypothetical protein [Spirulina subsalsa CS-330]MDB9502878.1 hypothetical protein [Spirulina major CS-329]